ncbi:hypothetical protein [Pasteurella multocida]|uniref:hypothetical protein n=1 Tax=Pasteurella multocida TaxID=747 RepID=UPI000A86E904|nr:hypothetical protein [Pasteurella multocida]MBF6982270.1 hypothetical protein [Pasteurella multocida]MBJ6776958.1 hypothetical protein [Pasteurella multocida subsp. multocida]MBM9430688.1 hypothetical protein [Pasteurella multocida]MCG5100996.1 hypothetical protein [Pasteurella multocida subsp. multocida]MCG5123856.1 hypothetical protein [Pasteurella multocida]
MSGKLNLPHTCPNCKKVTAKNYQELDEKFGFRNVPNGTTNQSWCRDCRSKS